MKAYSPADPLAPQLRQLEAERLRPSPQEMTAQESLALQLIELIGLVSHVVNCPGCRYCK